MRVVPISPYLLCQELYRDDVWKMMMCCIMLNRTQGNQVHMIREKLFRTYPTPMAILRADYDKLVELITPLGFCNMRANRMKAFSRDFLYKKWSSVTELHGIGKYGSDSYEIFVKNNINIPVTDNVLTKYLQWRKQNEKRITRRPDRQVSRNVRARA